MQETENDRLMKVYEELTNLGLITSQAKFMEAIGQARQNFKGFENGKRKVHLKHINNLEKHFAVNPDYIRYGQMPMFVKEKEGKGSANYSNIHQTGQHGTQQVGTGTFSTGGDASELAKCREELAEARHELYETLKQLNAAKDMIIRLQTK